MSPCPRLFSPFSYKAINIIIETPFWWSHLIPITSQHPTHKYNQFTNLRIKFPVTEFWGCIESITFVPNLCSSHMQSRLSVPRSLVPAPIQDSSVFGELDETQFIVRQIRSSCEPVTLNKLSPKMQWWDRQRTNLPISSSRRVSGGVLIGFTQTQTGKITVKLENSLLWLHVPHIEHAGKGWASLTLGASISIILLGSVQAEAQFGVSYWQFSQAGASLW